MEAVKKCPKCSAVNAATVTRCRDDECGYEFSGDEPGCLPKKELFLTATIARPAPAELTSHMAALAAAKATPERDWVTFGKTVAFSIGLFGLVALILFMLSGRPQPEGRPLLSLGRELSVGILIIVGLMALIGVMVATVRVLRGGGYSSPEKCVRAFYEKAGGDWLGKSFAGAWRCLSPVTRAEIGSQEQWEKEFKRTLRALRDRHREMTRASLKAQTYFTPRNFAATEIAPDAAVVECQLEVSGSETVEKGMIIYGSLIIPQEKVAVRRGKTWYVTSGSFDLPSSLT